MQEIHIYSFKGTELNNSRDGLKGYVYGPHNSLERDTSFSRYNDNKHNENNIYYWFASDTRGDS